MSKLTPLHEVFSSASIIWVIHPQTIPTDRIIAMLLTHPPLFKSRKIIISDDSSEIAAALGAAIPPELTCSYSAFPNYIQSLTTATVPEPLYFFPDSITKLLNSISALSLPESGRANYRIIAPISMCNTSIELKQIEQTLGVKTTTPLFLSVRPLDPGPALDYKLHIVEKKDLATRCRTMIALFPHTKHLVVSSDSQLKVPSANAITALPFGEVKTKEQIGSIHFLGESISPEIYNRWMERIYRRENYALFPLPTGIDPVLTLTINFYIDSETNPAYARLAEIINERHERYLSWERSASPILYDSESGMCISVQNR